MTIRQHRNRAVPLLAALTILVPLAAPPAAAHDVPGADAPPDAPIALAVWADNDGNDEFVSITPGGDILRETELPQRQVHHLRWSPDGSQVALESRYLAPAAYIMDVDTGDAVRLDWPRGGLAWQPDWSPEGDRLAFRVENPCVGPACPSAPPGIYVYDVATGESERAVAHQDAPPGNHVLWDPAGEWFATYSTPRGDTLSRVNTDGTGQETIASFPDAGILDVRWAQDGSELYVATTDDAGLGRGTLRGWVVDRDGSRPTELFSMPNDGEIRNLSWSADGEWITYSVSRVGLFVARAEPGAEPVPIPYEGRGPAALHWQG